MILHSHRSKWELSWDSDPDSSESTALYTMLGLGGPRNSPEEAVFS